MFIVVESTLEPKRIGDTLKFEINERKRTETLRGLVKADPTGMKKMLDILDSDVPDPVPSHAVDSPHRKFKAAVYLQKKEEGRRTTSFTQGYKPQFFFKTTSMTGAIQRLYTGGDIDCGPIETSMPGDFVNMEVVLLNEVAMSVGLKFAVQEGERSIGTGVITEIME